jgi:hypothetical protein
MEKCKCERCGRIRDLFQYTKWEVDRFVDQVKDNGVGESPRYTTETINLAERRGLCEECSVEVNKREYDKKCVNECHFAAPYGWVPEAGCEIHDRPTPSVGE